MPSRVILKLSTGAAALLMGAFSAPIHAQDGPRTAIASEQGEFARFVPRPTGKAVTLDYELWTVALRDLVLSMGPSTRKGANTVDPGLGTRFTFGHDSRFRMEGNRVVFSFLEDGALETISAYRADLERIGSELDITALPRDEQLAFWLNLHNVAMVEQIGLHYPVTSPDKIQMGDARTPLDTTKFLTVAGVSLSLHDIRTKIVYPNWSNPKVFYGFFHGEVGGPSIQRQAFSGGNVSQLLDNAAREFVNSLRGVEGRGDTIMVSKLYEEAAPYYFPKMASDLREHLAIYAEDDVKALLAQKPKTRTGVYVDDIADLAAGEVEPVYTQIESNGRQVGGGRITPSVARLLTERTKKYEELRREGRVGTVIVLPGSSTEEGADKGPTEVE